MDKFENLVEGKDYILLDARRIVSKDKLIKDLQFEVGALTKYVLEVSTILQRNGSTEGIHDEVLNLISRWDRKQREYFAKEWDWPSED